MRDARTGRPLRYRLNGPFVLAATVGLWALAGSLGLLPWDWLYTHRWAGLAGSSAVGLAFSLAMVAAAPAGGKPFLVEFYKGRLENPQFFGGRLDARMFLYLVGATMLALNVLSFAAHHVVTFGLDAFPGVYLYTYDLFAERVGFKLGWGCFTFYPYFYAVGLWAVADLPAPRWPAWLLAAAAAVFFAGWILSRGANLQKYLFKTAPDRALLGALRPRAIRDGDRALLCSGFWGIARHVNYLGEILMALGLTLCLGRPAAWAAWIYPLYYVALLFPRERSDERRCAAKYGALWDEYRRRVPRRIIPGIY